MHGLDRGNGAFGFESLMKKFGETLLLIAISIGVFLLVNTVHFQFLPVHVVLYDAMLDAAIAVVVTGIAIWFYFHRRLSLSPLELTLSLAVGGLLCAMYAVMGPAIVDRSLSIYILEKLEQRGGGIKYDAMPSVFINEYIPEHHLTDIRITEQLDSGTIGLKDGCVYLTKRGKAIVALTRFYRLHVLPKHRQIMGQYTDALTDPFRNSVADVPYKCTPPTP